MYVSVPPVPFSIRPIVLLSMASFCSMAVLRAAELLLPAGTTPGAASVIATAYAFAYDVFQVVYGPLGERGMVRAGGIFVFAGFTPAAALQDWPLAVAA